MCALREPLEDIGRIEIYALLLLFIIIIIIIIIIFILLFLLLLFIIPYCAQLNKNKKRKKIALPTMWK